MQHKCSKQGGRGVKGRLNNVKKTDDLVLWVVPKVAREEKHFYEEIYIPVDSGLCALGVII